MAGTTSSAGSSATLLNNPMDIAFDTNGILYVADNTNDRLQKFVNGSTAGVTTSNLTLNNPTAVFITNNEIIFLVDSLNYRVQKWNNSLVTIVAGGHGAGSTLDKILTTNGLYVDSNFNIYVSDTGNHRVSFWAAGNNSVGLIVRILTS